MQAMMGMDFGFTAMPVEVAGEGREAKAAGIEEGAPGESNAALLTVWAMLLQQQLQPLPENLPAGGSWEGEGEDIQEVTGREGEEQPRRVAEMWGGVVGATAERPSQGGLDVFSAGMEAIEEARAGSEGGAETAARREGAEESRAGTAVWVSLDGASGVERESRGLRKEIAAGVVLAGPVEDQKVETGVDRPAEGVRLEGRGVAREQAEAAGEQAAAPFETVLELERNWRAGLWKTERGERQRESTVMGSGVVEEGGESKLAGKETRTDVGGPVREERLEWHSESAGQEDATRVVEERREARERDEARRVEMQPVAGDGAVGEGRGEVISSRVQASEGRAKGAEMASAQRRVETENFVLPGPPVSQEKKTIAIRIPLSEANAGGARRHLDIVFEQKRNDLTLLIHSPSLDLQREVESAMPSLMERLRGENWSAKASEPVMAARSGEGATELVRPIETLGSSGAALENIRESLVNQNGSSSGFSFEDSPRQRGERRDDPEEPNPEREETWRDEFVEQLGA